SGPGPTLVRSSVHQAYRFHHGTVAAANLVWRRGGQPLRLPADQTPPGCPFLHLIRASVGGHHSAIVALRQQAEQNRVDGGLQDPDAAITKDELAQAGMVAAELPALIIGRCRQWKIRAGGAGVAG